MKNSLNDNGPQNPYNDNALLANADNNGAMPIIYESPMNMPGGQMPQQQQQQQLIGGQQQVSERVMTNGTFGNSDDAYLIPVRSINCCRVGSLVSHF